MPKYQFHCEVAPQYLPEQSDPERGVHAFAYTITVSNTGEVAALPEFIRSRLRPLIQVVRGWRDLPPEQRGAAECSQPR